MDPIDYYGLEAADAKPVPSESPSSPQPSLEEEVHQVIGSLGGFWGSFRKQSASAFAFAKKEVVQVVEQTRSDIVNISTNRNSMSSPRASTSDEKGEGPSSPVDKGKQRETASPRASIDTINQPSFNAFLSRIQENLPPQLAPDNISQTFQNLQKQIQPAIAGASNAASQVAAQASQAASQMDIQQIQRNLVAGVQRVQNEPLVAEYRTKGGALFKEAGDYLREAVQVLPPDQSGAPNMSWDGSDVWAYPSPIGTTGWGGSSREAEPRRSVDTTIYAKVKRADALLARLKYDPEMIKLDPATDPVVKERYSSYVAKEITGKGGLQGQLWSKEIANALADLGPASEALKANRDKLVPKDLSSDEFWQRYFFRVHQIMEEENTRKSLLAGASTEENFTWDDDEETDASNDHSASKPPAGKKSTPVVEQKGATRSTSTLTAKRSKEAPLAPSGPSSSAASPRESEESYAVLSPPVRPKEPTSEKEESGSEEEESGSEEEDDDEDEDEEEDDDDDEEGEEEEDWE